MCKVTCVARSRAIFWPKSTVYCTSLGRPVMYYQIYWYSKKSGPLTLVYNQILSYEYVCQEYEYRTKYTRRKNTNISTNIRRVCKVTWAARRRAIFWPKSTVCFPSLGTSSHVSPTKMVFEETWTTYTIVYEDTLSYEYMCQEREYITKYTKSI